MLDRFFGRDAFLNEIIWAYDYGARSKQRWSASDTLFIYVKDRFVFVRGDGSDPLHGAGLVTLRRQAR